MVDPAACRIKGGLYYPLFRLVAALGAQELAVQAGDVAQLDVLGALGGTGTGVGAVTESQLVHLGQHGLHAALGLGTSLGQQCELADLGAEEQHGGTVLAGSYTGTATDAGSTVHSLVGGLLADGDGVSILCTASLEADVTTGLLDLIEGVAVDHQVLDYGESSRAPGLNRDGVAILEAAHVELASGSPSSGSVRMSVNV